MYKKRKIIIFLLIAIMFIIGLIYTSVQQGINLNKLNNVYKDIEIIEQRVDAYYLNNGNLPIVGNKIPFEHSINPNDNSDFYEIDLEKLENISINYGKKQEGIEDIYIINEQSHTIYYLKGIEYQKRKIYSKNLNYQEIDLEQYK